MTIYRHRGIAARAALFVFFCAAWAAVHGSVLPSLPPTTLVDAYGKLPILFEGNRGQADPTAKFIARGNGYAVFLTPQETLITLSRTGSTQRASPTSLSAPAQTVIGMRFAGSNQAAPLIGERRTESTSNYFLGPDPTLHVTDIPHYGSVRRAGIYPGIDAVFYGNQRQLEYDLVVAPGADPRAIRLSFTGARKVSIDRVGNLVLQGATGDVVQHKPVIYQERDGERKPIAGRYIKRGREVGFQIAAYDQRLPLIIDPVVSYATFLGGVKNDSGQAIAVDAAGNAYITGYTSSPKFPAANPIDRRIGHNEQDAFVVKLNATGTALIYSTYLGGSKGFDSGNGIAVDSAGNAYVAGTTTGKGFPTTTGAYQSVGTSWVAKLNPTGNALVYSTAIAGARVNALALGAGGNAYVAGWADSTFITTPGSFQPLSPIKTGNGSRSNAFVAKLNPTGTALIFGTFLAGNGTDEARGLAIDVAGNAYVAGATNSPDFPTLNSIQPYRGQYSLGTVPDHSNAFITKLNASGTGLLYSTFLGGNFRDGANAIAVDGAGQAHVTGTTSGSFPTYNAFQSFKNIPDPSFSAAFVAKFTASGSALVYSSLIGGGPCPVGAIAGCPIHHGDQGLAVAINAAGDAYYVGSALSIGATNPIQPDFRQATNNVYVAKVAPTGQAITILLIGGSGIAGDTASGDVGRGVALDALGAIYLTGTTSSIDFPVTAGAYQPTLLYNTRKDAGGQDAFVVKLIPTTNYNVTLASSANPSLASQPVSITAMITASGSPPISFGNVSISEVLTAGVNLTPSNGVASFVTSFNPGIHRLSAVYRAQSDGGAAQLYQVTAATGPCQAANAGALSAPGKPLVVMIAPVPCSTITLPSPIDIDIDAVDTDGGLAGIDIYANGILVGTTTQSWNGLYMYRFAWSNPAPAPGTYSLTAVARDTTGQSTTSVPLVFSVGQPNQAPAVSLTAPATGSMFRVGNAVTVTANAVDPDGSIARVDFLADGTVFAATNVPPYSAVWSNFIAGSHMLSAVAIDSQGARTTSANVSVTVAPNSLPSVSLTTPLAGAQFISPATINFAATASDTDGTIAKVEFMLDGAVVGTSTMPPYAATATGVLAGTHSITAKATDNDNGTRTSTAISVTVAANQLPTVSLTSPTSGSTFTAPTDITLTANAADSDGSVVKVEFFVGTTLLDTRTGAPYTTVWKNPLPGSYTLTAKATDNRGATTTSTAVPITVGGTAVRITAPADGTALAAPAEITLQISAVTANGNSLTKLEVFDGASLLRTFNVSGNSININYGLLDVETGSHVYTVKATLNTGTVVTSEPVTVNVQAAAAVQLSTLSNFYLAPAAIDLYANVTPAANTTITKVEFFSNGNTLIGTVTAAPYNFRWSSVVAGSYVVTAKVTDSRGLTTTSAALNITVSSSVSIQLNAALNGSTVNEDAIYVSGTVGAPPNSAVNVNGQLASVTSGGQFYLNDLSLQPGVNTVMATVTALDGQTANQVISITRSTAPATFVVTVPAGGLATAASPFAALVTVENRGNGVFATVTVSCDDPGAGLVSATLGSFNCSYTAPGVHSVRVTVRDAGGGVVYEVVKVVTIKSPYEQIANVKAVYTGLIDRLKAGDKAAALKMFFGHAQSKYDAIFTALGANLALAASQLGDIKGVTVDDEIAEIVVTRMVAGQQRTFLIQLSRGEDGIWRIESM